MRQPDLLRAQRMALRVLADRRIAALPVDPLALLRQCRRVAVFTRQEAAESLGMSEAEFDRQYAESEAFTLTEGEGQARRSVVVYGAEGNPARLRFTLAHELGHIVMKHTDIDEPSEKEANMFASHLLCPRPALLRLAQRFAPLTAEQAAAVFYVSVGCARSLKMDADDLKQDELWHTVDELLCPSVERLEKKLWHGPQHVLTISRTLEA